MSRLEATGPHSVAGVVAAMLATVGAALFLGLLTPSAAGAIPAVSEQPAVVARPGVVSQSQGCGKDGCVRVYDISGLIDPVIVDFIEQGVADAQATAGTIGVVLELNSDGVVVSDKRFTQMVERLRQSTVPVSAWIGPSGATVRGGAAELAAVLGGSSIAPGSTIGEAGEQRLPTDEYGDIFGGKAVSLRTTTVGADKAVALGVVDRVAPTAGDHLVGLDGITTKVVKDAKGQPRRQPVTRAVIAKLPLVNQLFHTVASPAVAYLLLGVGVGLLIFEFFTAGVGVAGVIGAGSFLLAGYGFGVLPFRPWALALLLLAAPAFAIDVQAGVPRVWTVLGMAAWIIGSFFVFDGVHLPWLALATGLIGMAVAMISGMPSMVRSRFGTPTIGREWMVGSIGAAVTAIDPDGTVRVSDGLWQARTNRATPLSEGASVRVVAIDGVTLEVEPEEGGAIDYREVRSRS